MPFKSSLAVKLALSYIAVTLISFGAIAFFLDRGLEESSRRALEASLVKQGTLIRTQIPLERIAREDSEYVNSLVKSLAPMIKCRLTVVSRDGIVLADSQKFRDEIAAVENHAHRPEIRKALRGDIGIETHYSSIAKIDMLYVALPLGSVQAPVGALRLSLPLAGVEKSLSEIRLKIIFALLCALALALLLGILFASMITRPLTKITRSARRFSAGDFSRKIFPESRDEIGELARALNTMAGQVEDTVARIQEQNQRLAAVFISMIEGVIVVDSDSRIVAFNPAVERIFGVAKKDAQRKFFLEAIGNHSLAEVIEGVLKRGEPLSRELRLIVPVQKVFLVNATPISGEGGVTGCLMVLHDITEIRRLETVRRDFVANVSHEIKTPLTSIKGFVETLLDEDLADKGHVRQFLSIINEHTARLDALLNDLLSLSYLESSQVTLTRGRVGLKELADKVALGCAAQLKKKNVSFRNEIDGALIINGDSDKITQVFTNLIDNAIKFNREGGWVRISSTEEGPYVRVTVSDSGCGIPPKELSRIFERFYRVDKARSRDLGGTGLGLSIVRHIVELHGGSVGAESSEGFGAAIWCTFPHAGTTG